MILKFISTVVDQLKQKRSLLFTGCGPKECKSELKLLKGQVSSPAPPLNVMDKMHVSCIPDSSSRNNDNTYLPHSYEGYMKRAQFLVESESLQSDLQWLNATQRLPGIQASSWMVALTKLNTGVVEWRVLGLCVRWTWLEFLLCHLLMERPWGSHLTVLNLAHEIKMIRSYWTHWPCERWTQWLTHARYPRMIG